MVPPVAVVLDELPVTPGGKLDRRALLAPDLTTDLDQYVAPVNSTEETLASIVAGLLGLERVGVTESFFALGGDSIMSWPRSTSPTSAEVQESSFCSLYYHLI